MMRRRTSGPRGRDGFTIIEVLIAMVILAVGLLALGALGIGSAQMVNRADRQSGYAAAATDTLERVLGRIRDQQPLPTTGRTYLLRNDTVRIRIDSTVVATNPVVVRRFDVAVTVVPTPRSFIQRRDSLRVVGSVIR